ncbi:MAG: DUF2225 domain-containing protein, partial [Bacteroidota bacterium]
MLFFLCSLYAVNAQTIDKEQIIKGDGNDFFDTAMYYYKTGNVDSSICLFQKALSIYKKNDDTIKIGDTYIRLGIIYRDRGDYSVALDFFQSALSYHEIAFNTEGMAQANNSIGILYMAWKNFPRAIGFYNQALVLYKKTNNRKKQADVLNNIGLIYRYTNCYDSAMVYFQKTLEIREEDGDECNIASSLHNIGIIYNATGQYNKALNYYDQALNIRRSQNARKDIAVSLNAIGKTYMNLSKFEKADTIFKQALNIAKPMQLTELIVTLYENMTLNYSAMEKHEAFLKYFNLYIGYYDSVFNEEKHRQLMDLQTRYETEKKEQEIAVLQGENQIQQLENKNNRLLLLILITIIAGITLAGIILYRQYKLRTEQRLQLLRQKMLRLQMNPHFIFNAMGAIQEYIYDQEPLKAASYLSDFSNLFRFILESSTKEYISLSKEIEMLDYYIQLQKLRFKKAFDYSINLDETIDPALYAVPPMLLQPFVENAIEHGLNHMESGGKISISIKKNNNELLIEIRDNGIGLSHYLAQTSKTDKEYQSMAIPITRERLQLY